MGMLYCRSYRVYSQESEINTSMLIVYCIGLLILRLKVTYFYVCLISAQYIDRGYSRTMIVGTLEL